MNIYEMHGRLAEAAQKSVEDLQQTLELLRQLKAGSIPLEDLQVLKDGWRVEKAESLPGNVVRFPTSE